MECCNVYICLFTEPQDHGITFVLTPASPTLYNQLNLKCSLNHAQLYRFSDIDSITITKNHGGVLSSVDKFDGVKKSRGFGSPKVTGNINGHAPYLSMTWTQTTAKLDGTYRCEIRAVDRHNCKYVRFFKNVNVNVHKPTYDEWIRIVQNLQIELTTCKKETIHLKQTITQLKTSSHDNHYWTG